MFTGGSTSATAMSSAFFYLSRNPSAYARLASEIRSTFTTAHQIRQGPQLSGCKYLRAVIDETIRMPPSTLAAGWREQDPTSIAKGERLIVDGHVIPPGTQIAVSSFALQHNSAYFPNPYTFSPDRWMPPEEGTVDTDEDQESRATMKRSWVPFSLGNRSCAGKPMAYLEMSLEIARTMWYFDFEKAPGEAGRLGGGIPGRKDGRGRVDEFQLYDGTVVNNEGPILSLCHGGNTGRNLARRSRWRVRHDGSSRQSWFSWHGY